MVSQTHCNPRSEARHTRYFVKPVEPFLVSVLAVFKLIRFGIPPKGGAANTSQPQ